MLLAMREKKHILDTGYTFSTSTKVEAVCKLDNERKVQL